MQQLVCTIDTSSMIALDHLGLMPQLSLIFSRVLLPKAVRTELFRRRNMKDRVRAILRDYAFIEPCDAYDKATVEVLLIERAKLGDQDRGEVEAVVQAAEIGTMVIVDDRWGRELAALHGRDFHGTLRVLRRLLELEHASPAVTRDRLVELFRRGIRLPLREVNAFLAEIGEPPIAKAGDT
jgi:predicted nucleic acid-binding protein